MKYLYSWIKDYYPELPNLEDLEPLFVQLGHDVELVTPVAREGLLVAQIKSITPHPNANKLFCVRVDTGNKELNIVCGADNLKENLNVVLATPGTILPSGGSIQVTAIRGEQSEGMLCSSQELGINSDSSGLHLLPDNAIVGKPAEIYLPPDAVFTLDITSDRGDVLSHFGLARDLYALQKESALQFDFDEPKLLDNDGQLQLDTIHPDCQGINFVLATSSTVNPTPTLWQTRLVLVGQKCINLPTDLTNYIMLSFGQPLHAYDADRLPSYQFGVRRAHEGERFISLQSKELRLTPQNLVITAGDSPIALAGVIGSNQSSTNSNTTRIIFESADFVPKAISLSARGLNLLTDAALRFERQIDAKSRLKIFNHAMSIWSKATGGTFLANISSNPGGSDIPGFKCNLVELTDFIGSSITYPQIHQLLQSVGCAISPTDETNWIINPPSWRHDLVHLEDYAEELIRLFDVNKLDKKPLTPSVPQWKRSPYWKNEFLKDILVATGLTEVQTYPFISREELQLFGTDQQKSLELTHLPMPNKQFMRTSLSPGLLSVIASNPEVPHLGLFEIANVYHPEGESEQIGIIMASNSQTHIDKEWQNLFERLRLPVSSWMSRINIIEPPVLKHYKIRKTIVTILELPIGQFNQTKTYDVSPVTIPDLDSIEVQPVSHFQTSRRDVSMILAKSLDAYKVAADILRWGKTNKIIEATVFDVYRDTSIGNDNQSIAVRITFQAPDHTLTQSEIHHYLTELNKYLQETYHAIIR